MPFRRRNKPRKFNRLFFATDVHGSDDCFRKFLNAADHYDSSLLVLGGDVTGKVIVPLVERDAGTWTCQFMGREQILEGSSAVAELEKVVRRSGSYLYRTDPEGLSAIEEADDGEREVEGIALRLMLERLEEWIELAEAKLGGTGTRIFMGGGNDDPYEIDELLEQSELIVGYDNRVVQLDENHEMLGLGYANPTPWNCPRDISEAELARRFEALAGDVHDMSNCLFCIHVPPVDSNLDTCPKLDTTDYPPKVIKDRAGEVVLHGAGSSAIRSAIESHQPLAGLHGHVHESRGVNDIGRTKIFNPGSEYSEGILRGLIVNLTPDRLLSYQFTSG